MPARRLYRRAAFSASPCCFLRGGRRAGPVCGILEVAGPAVFRMLWVRTQRAAEAFGALPQHLIRRDTSLDPVFERTDRVERVDAGAAAAVTHSRRHEQPHPVALVAAHLLEH